MEPSIELIWNDFKCQLLSYILSKVSDKYAAEDILQDVFIKVYGHIDEAGNLSNLRAWLYKITHNTIIDYYRAKGSELVRMDDIEEQPLEGRESVNMNEDIFACLKALLAGLPERYRIPLELYALHGSKHQEIADKLGISVSGSKTRVQRGRDKLKKLLSSCCELEFDRRGNIVEYRRKNLKCSTPC